MERAAALCGHRLRKAGQREAALLAVGIKADFAAVAVREAEYRAALVLAHRIGWVVVRPETRAVYGDQVVEVDFVAVFTTDEVSAAGQPARVAFVIEGEP